MSSARRFYARDLPQRGGEVRLDGVASKHARVLRLEAGDEVVLFDGRGMEARGTIARIDDAVVCAVEPPRANEARISLVLCQCVPKGGKLDDIVRACTELGVSAIHLVESERSVPKASDERSPKKLERLERVAREAARQSSRSDVPDLVPAASLDVVIARAPEIAAKMAFAPGGERTLDQACPSDAKSAWVLIGPEGGLSSEELRRARDRGFSIVGLGPTVLRVENAAPIALALVAYRLGAFDLR